MALKEKKEGYQFASQENHIHVRGIRISKEGTLDNHEIVSCTLNNLNRLPDTSAEIKFIASTLGADPVNDVFLGKRASEHQVKSLFTAPTAFRSAMPSAPIISPVSVMRF